MLFSFAEHSYNLQIQPPVDAANYETSRQSVLQEPGQLKTEAWNILADEMLQRMKYSYEQ